MPANLSPEYRQAEQAFRSAHYARERLECLKEMLRTIPRYKGTEHIQADIKSRIRELTRELSLPHRGPARAGAGHGPSKASRSVPSISLRTVISSSCMRDSIVLSPE